MIRKQLKNLSWVKLAFKNNSLNHKWYENMVITYKDNIYYDIMSVLITDVYLSYRETHLYIFFTDAI